MISHGKNVKVFSANANKSLAEGICRKLWLPLGDSTVTSFADGEVSMTINESVRGSDVFLVQPTCKPVNDHLMELLVMIDACKRASAGRITAVMPYFGYARQDRKAKGRDPISAKLVANMIEAAGADRVLAALVAPVPEFRVILQLLIASHLKMAEVDLPQIAHDLVRPFAEQDGKRLLRAAHPARIIVLRLRRGGRIGAQRGDASLSQWQICAAVVKPFQVALGQAVADECQCHGKSLKIMVSDAATSRRKYG